MPGANFGWRSPQKACGEIRQKIQTKPDGRRQVLRISSRTEETARAATHPDRCRDLATAWEPAELALQCGLGVLPKRRPGSDPAYRYRFDCFRQSLSWAISPRSRCVGFPASSSYLYSPNLNIARQTIKCCLRRTLGLMARTYEYGQARILREFGICGCEPAKKKRRSTRRPNLPGVHAISAQTDAMRAGIGVIGAFLEGFH